MSAVLQPPIQRRPSSASSSAAERFLARVRVGETSVRELAGLTDDEMRAAYLEGRAHYDAGRVAEATAAFLALVAVEPREPVYWLALGACAQAAEDHEHALEVFALAALLDGLDPLPHFHAARSLVALGEGERAEAAVSACVARALGHPEHAEVFGCALHLREELRLATVRA